MFDRVKNALGGDKKSQFWQWFTTNEDRIYAFEADQEAIFNQIEARMKRVNPDLCFAFGKVQEDGRREFVISAGGIVSAFPTVESLYNSAPDLKRWIWVKYRPRLDQMLDVQYGGKTVKAADVRYLITPQGKKVDIILFFPEYSESEHEALAGIGFLHLDNILGEYAVATQVGTIDFLPVHSELYGKSHPLAELASEFDAYIGSVGG